MLPEISIEFEGKARSFLKRSRGIVALIIEETESAIYELKTSLDIPKTLTTENRTFIDRAFKGNPNKVIVVAVTAESGVEAGLDILETMKFNYLAIKTTGLTDGNTVATWIKNQRDNKDNLVKAVLANEAADHEGIINFTTQGIVVDGEEVETEDFTSRIAGLLAGLPLTRSATYVVLDEVEDVERLSKDEYDTKIENGEFVLIHDGEKVKVGRGVNSLTTVELPKTEDFKKILIVDKMDMWKEDIKMTIADGYVGKFANTYDNKCLLITDIRLYNKRLARQGILDNSSDEYNQVDIDMKAQGDYLESLGQDVESMSEDEIKKANTGSKVFISTNLKFTDAMEDFYISVAI